jgi:hypothetical protein
VPIKNYTTEVGEERTVGEIMGLLAGKGARSIRIDYDEQNRPTGVCFILLLHELPIPFRLPCNFTGVFKAMSSAYKDRSAKYRWERNPESTSQSRRVAWRIIKDWVAAQMALVEAEQASMAQAFFPYAVANEKSSVTAFDQFLESVSKQKRLNGGHNAGRSDERTTQEDPQTQD